MIDAKNLIYSYDDGTKALKGIDFKISKGDMVALIGKNGAGKSTLLLHLNGIIKPDKGEIFIDNEKMKYNKKSLIKFRQKVGIVFQNPDDQIFAPTVEEDVAFGPLNLKLSQDETQKRVTEALEKVGMSGFEKKAPHYLSGGQKKRVAIAGILAMKPEVIILDEPTAGLDPAGVEKIMNLLMELNEEGITILVSTHDVDLVAEFANKVYVMNEGEIIGKGTPEDIFNNEEIIEKANLRLPLMAELFKKLKNSGKINNTSEKYPLTIDEAYEKITEILK